MSDEKERAAFEVIRGEYGFDDAEVNAYPAHCFQSLAFDLFKRGYQAGRADLLAENERLREALEEYACPDNCENDDYFKDGSCYLGAYCGKIGRNALAQQSAQPDGGE